MLAPVRATPRSIFVISLPSRELQRYRHRVGGGGPRQQRLFPGTTAWRISYGRRQVVEGVNAMLKGGFVNIQHKFFRIFGLTKMTLMLAFTVVGYNLDAIRSFIAKKAAEKATASAKKTRAQRREGTWAQLLGSDRPGSGRAPPPT